MGKVITGLVVVLGLWAGMEFYTAGLDEAFGGVFASVTDKGEVVRDNRSTARRAGDAVDRARDEATARRERMLGE